MDPGGPPPGLGPRLPTQSAQWKESRYIVQNGEPAQLPCIRPSFRPPELVLARAGRPKLNTGAAQTGASTLNAPTGAATAHAAIVPAGAGGRDFADRHLRHPRDRRHQRLPSGAARANGIEHTAVFKSALPFMPTNAIRPHFRHCQDVLVFVMRCQGFHT